MIIETLTVTTTPTSLLDLLNTARSTVATKSPKISSVLFRIDTGSLKVVSAEDVNTVESVIILDPGNTIQPQPFASYEGFNLEESLISVDSGTVAVGMIASQD